jgi:hypothetical protein
MSMKNLNAALADLGFSTRGEAFDFAVKGDTDPLDSLAFMEKRLNIQPAKPDPAAEVGPAAEVDPTMVSDITKEPKDE